MIIYLTGRLIAVGCDIRNQKLTIRDHYLRLVVYICRDRVSQNEMCREDSIGEYQNYSKYCRRFADAD